ncbi:MAG: metallophosphoesterase family protein [Phycisphaerales bacterium]|nr:metallophosphoesterase family protein [Phycisphaerales bacterium]
MPDLSLCDNRLCTQHLRITPPFLAEPDPSSGVAGVDPATDTIPPIREPVVVLSDLHIGHAASLIDDPASLAPLLQDAGTVIFNGDTIEIDLSLPIAEACQHVDRLLQVTDRAGVTPIFVAGNHDPSLVTCRHLDLCDGHVLVTHGDCLHPSIAPWSGQARFARKLFRELMLQAEYGQVGETDPMNAALRAGQLTAIAVSRTFAHPQGGGRLLAQLMHVARFAVKPHRVLQILLYWHQLPHLAARFAQRYRPNARVMLIGHSHRPGVWRIGGRVIINTGAFQPLGSPALARIADGTVAYHRIVHTHGEWRAVDKPTATFALPDASAEPIEQAA